MEGLLAQLAYHFGLVCLGAMFMLMLFFVAASRHTRPGPGDGCLAVFYLFVLLLLALVAFAVSLPEEMSLLHRIV